MPRSFDLVGGEAQTTDCGRTRSCRYPAVQQRALESRLHRGESRTRECLPQTLSSSTVCSRAASGPRRAVMWCQCLGPRGTVPSGAKPLRPCCHISPPIISSRSAFSFRTHFPLPSSSCARPSPCSYLQSVLHLCTLTASSLLSFCLNNQAFLPPPVVS